MLTALLLTLNALFDLVRQLIGLSARASEELTNGHFNSYSGEGFEQIVAYELEFLMRHIKLWPGKLSKNRPGFLKCMCHVDNFAH